ncbi:DUF4363 family protein [Oceanobacillus saliphilus]|uniref:DUF4363 family protein n=1 Tax=Oceanobacillus saliphilus TaxID=2925834 RepID=UPI00201E687C|nr:DUF4363 family protein [Oceanobacillus saliphilus]
MKKFLFIFMALLILLSGCTNKVGGDYFFKQINMLEQSLENPDWKKIATQVEALKDMYDKNKWKVQLIGDEGEYEGIDESIRRLIAAIKEEDIINIRMELATIESLLEGVYTL